MCPDRRTSSLVCQNMTLLLVHIESLGLHLNQEKSRFVPYQVTQFLVSMVLVGMVIDSRTATVSLGRGRRQSGPVWHIFAWSPFIQYRGVSSAGDRTHNLSYTQACRPPAGHLQVATGPLLVEVPEQSRQGQQAAGDPLPVSVIRCIPRRLGECTRALELGAAGTTGGLPSISICWS